MPILTFIVQSCALRQGDSVLLGPGQVLFRPRKTFRLGKFSRYGERDLCFGFTMGNGP